MASSQIFDHKVLARSVLSFWFEEHGRNDWFARKPKFDAEIRSRFGAAYEAARDGRLEALRKTPEGALALLILLDQFSRNLFRESPQAFAADPKARSIAREALRRRFDMIAPQKRQPFFYMPFMHSEDLTDQEFCVALFKARLPASFNLRYARDHRDIIARFGRFPHRNKILGRASTPEEIAFLAAGGFNP